MKMTVAYNIETMKQKKRMVSNEEKE